MKTSCTAVVVFACGDVVCHEFAVNFGDDGVVGTGAYNVARFYSEFAVILESFTLANGVVRGLIRAAGGGT